jgi:hypothetical protein
MLTCLVLHWVTIPPPNSSPSAVPATAEWISQTAAIGSHFGRRRRSAMLVVGGHGDRSVQRNLMLPDSPFR